MITHFEDSICGWFDFQDIYDEAIKRAQDGDILVETGTWFGKSICYLGVEALNSGKKLRIITIDNDTQYQEYADFPGALISRNEEILKNIKPLKNVQFINGDSLIEATKFEDQSLKMVFLDALHTYEFVAKEMRVWFPKVKPGGIFAGHDIEFQGVKQAVNEFCKEYNLTFSIIKSSWFIQL